MGGDVLVRVVIPGVVIFCMAVVGLDLTLDARRQVQHAILPRGGPGRRSSGPATLHGGDVGRPERAGVMHRIEVAAHPEFAGAAGEAFSTPAIVEIETVDGRRLIKSVRAMRGHPERPVPYARLVEKFRECAEPVLGADRTREATALIDDLPALPEIGPLLRSLVPSA